MPKKKKSDPEYQAEPISLLIPTYNRANFLPLLSHNIYTQDYPKHMIEIVIDDDGDKPLIPEGDREKWAKGLGVMGLKYIYNARRKPIGEKRNRLVKYASHEILAFMDDDDIYCPAYLSHSFYTLRNGKNQLVGSNCMIFTYPHYDFKITAIRCKHKCQIHEATMVFTKKYHREMGGFNQVNKAEGGAFIQNRDHDIGLTDINYVMVCVCHQGNTIDKECFKDRNVGENLKMPVITEMLKKILDI